MNRKLPPALFTLPLRLRLADTASAPTYQIAATSSDSNLCNGISDHRLLISAALFLLFLFCSPAVFAATAGGGKCPTNPGVPAGVTGCYFVDSATGSDSNAGTSEAAPLAHLPGMQTYTGNITPTAGEGFILRGCSVWPNASFPITWTWGGTASAPIYVGVDQSWYNTANCGSSWNRPIFDAGNTSIGSGTCNSTNNWFLIIQGETYVTFDWIEYKNHYWNVDINNNCYLSAGYIRYYSNSDYLTVSNSYFHHWTHGSSATSGDNMIMGGQPNGAPGCANCYFTLNVVDNSDGDGSTCQSTDATCSGGGVNVNATSNVFLDMVTALKQGNQAEWGFNNIQGINMDMGCCRGPHPNLMETTGAKAQGTNGIFYIHDNYECCSPVGEYMQLGNPGETDYVYNNVIIPMNSSGSNGPDVPQTGGTSSWSLYMINNTVVWGVGCLNEDTGGHGTAINNFTFSNNHCIGTTNPEGGNPLVPIGTVSKQSNLGMPTSTATSQGYTGSATYAYSPKSDCTPSTCATVQAGTNLASAWPTPPSGFSSNDTSYACSETTISGVVQVNCPSRTANSRSSTGAWDIGAYQFGSGSSAPLAPTGLTAAVN